MQKIKAHPDYNDFGLWLRSDPKRYTTLRLGQAFIAWMAMVKQISIIDPDLFYCEDSNKAEKMIFAKYVNQEE